LIAGILNEGNQAFIVAEAMIKQLPLPKIVYVVRVVWRNIIVSAHNIVIMPVVILIFGGGVTWALLLWPLGVLLAVFALSGMAMIFGIVATRFRDLPQIISAALTVAFYITPVIWIKESLGDNELVEAIVSLNPLYHILQVMRLPLISQYPSLENWMWVVALGIALWTIGLLLFNKYEKRIAYWV
jgi:lipopolysaccharide transport system permease protein